MKRSIISIAIVMSIVMLGQVASVVAGRFSRGSVFGSSQGWNRGGNSGSWQGRFGNASGSRTVSQTGDGFDVNRQMQTQGGYSRDVNRDVDTQDRSIDRTSTATNPWGQSATRSRDTQGQAATRPSPATPRPAPGAKPKDKARWAATCTASRRSAAP